MWQTAVTSIITEADAASTCWSLAHRTMVRFCNMAAKCSLISWWTLMHFLQANATAHAAINGTTADASADSDSTGDLTTGAAHVTSIQATKPTARRLLQPVHTVMPLGSNGVPLQTTPEVFQNVPPLSTAANVPPQANITSSPSTIASPNSNSNAAGPAPTGAKQAATLPLPSLNISAKEGSNSTTTAVKNASTHAPHNSPVLSSPGPQNESYTSPGNSTDTLAVVGAGTAGAHGAANVINSTADKTSVSVQNSSAGSGDVAVQCQTISNIYGQKSLRCEKVAANLPVKLLAANMGGNSTWQAAEWDQSAAPNNIPVASSPSPQPLPINSRVTATAPGAVTDDVPASSAGSTLGNVTAAPVPSPGPAPAQTSGGENVPGHAAVSADIQPMSAAAPSSWASPAPQLSGMVCSTNSLSGWDCCKSSTAMLASDPAQVYEPLFCSLQHDYKHTKQQLFSSSAREITLLVGFHLLQCTATTLTHSADLFCCPGFASCNRLHSQVLRVALSFHQSSSQ